MKTEQRQTNTIKPYEKNAKKHPKKQVEQVAASIKEFGFNQPIVVDKNNVVIVGHGRLEAAKLLKMQEVPVLTVDLTEEQAKSYRLADNKLNESDWDMELVIEELKGLDTEMIELTGFDTDLIIEPEDKDDEVPDVPEEPQAKLGDIYQLGEHRLMCGSATELDNVEKLMDGKKADMVFTSPPYNANAKAGHGDIFNSKRNINLYDGGYEDNLGSSEYIEFTRKVLEICFDNTDGFIFWNVGYNANSRFEYIEQIQPFLGRLIEQICWKKSSAIPIKGSMRRAWEPIYLFSTSKVTLGLNKVETNLWEVNNTGSQHENHKACFPVELPSRAINLLDGVDLIYDPFGGSGSTLIAAEKLNRKCYMMELDPKYIDVIIKRWENYTGNKAVKL